MLCLTVTLSGCSALSDFRFQEARADAGYFASEAGIYSDAEGTDVCSDACDRDEMNGQERDNGDTDGCPGGGPNCEDGAIDNGADSVAPTIEAVSPAAASVSVALDVALTAAFSEMIDPKTVSEDAVYLQAAGTRVEGTLSYDEDRRAVSFVPAQRLKFLDEYTMTIRATVADLAGNALGEDYAWSFTTRDGQWTPTKLTEQQANYPKVALAGNGLATVIWQQWGGGTRSWGSSGMQVAGATNFEWAEATPVDTTVVASSSAPPHLAASASGRVVAVWENRGTTSTLYAAELMAGSRWEEPPRVVDSDRCCGGMPPVLAMNDSGAAILVWLAKDGTVWSVRSDSISGWGEPEQLGTQGDEGTSLPILAKINRHGRSLVLWEYASQSFHSVRAALSIGDAWETITLSETEPSNWSAGLDDASNAIVAWVNDGRVHAARYLEHIGQWVDTWGVTINPSSATDAKKLMVLANGDGAGLAIWLQADGLWANAYVSGADWGTPAQIRVLPGLAQFEAEIGLRGKAIVTWPESDRLWASHRELGGTWAMPQPIQSAAGAPNRPRIAMDPRGNATIIWQVQGPIRREIWANRHSALQGWGQSALITAMGIATPSFEQPQIAMSMHGDTIATFVLGDGSSGNVWVSEFL